MFGDGVGEGESGGKLAWGVGTVKTSGERSWEMREGDTDGDASHTFSCQLTAPLLSMLNFLNATVSL